MWFRVLVPERALARVLSFLKVYRPIFPEACLPNAIQSVFLFSLTLYHFTLGKICEIHTNDICNCTTNFDSFKVFRYYIHGMEIYNYYGSSKIHSFSNKDPYNFHSIFFPVSHCSSTTCIG